MNRGTKHSVWLIAAITFGVLALVVCGLGFLNLIFYTDYEKEDDLYCSPAYLELRLRHPEVIADLRTKYEALLQEQAKELSAQAKLISGERKVERYGISIKWHKVTWESREGLLKISFSASLDEAVGSASYAPGYDFRLDSIHSFGLIGSNRLIQRVNSWKQAIKKIYTNWNREIIDWINKGKVEADSATGRS